MMPDPQEKVSPQEGNIDVGQTTMVDQATMDQVTLEPDVSVRNISTGTGVLLGHYWSRSKEGSVIPGPATAIVSSNRPSHISNDLTKGDIRIGVILFLAAVLVRFYDLPNPPATIHEEVAVGAYINKYIGRAFFPSSEPPLAFLMYYLVSLFFNYDGNFPFLKQDHIYVGSRVPYIELRSFAALSGVILVVSAYYTVRLGGGHRLGALIASLFVLFDTSLAATSRYIFAEPLYLMFVGLTLLFWKLFERQQPFSAKYYFWGFVLAVNLGCVVSTRWIGVLTVLYVLVASCYNVFWIFADLQVSWWAYTKHIVFRAAAFTAIPLFVYAAVLQTHLLIASGPHDGDYLLAPAHQDVINKNRRPPVHADIVSGSVLTIRHLDTHSYLHSHDEFYPVGSRQQQVSLYQHTDLNNVWVMENATKPNFNENAFLNNFRHGESVKLRHLQSTRRLHSHEVKAPVSDNDYQFEVSAYGADGFPGDLNDMWSVEIVAQYSTPGRSARELRTLQTVFRLRHLIQKCYLYGHRTQLPAWGFAQQEVTCNRYPAKTGALWYVETNYHPNFPKEVNVTRDMIHYGNMTRVGKIKDMHNVIKVSREMTPDQTAFNTAPVSWPLGLSGLPFYRSHHRQILVISNLVCWWGALASLAMYGVFKAVVFLRWQRGLRPVVLSADMIRFDHEMGHALIAWGCHFVPLIPKTTAYTFVTYLPAFYMSCVAAGHMFSIFFRTFGRHKFVQVLVVTLVAVLTSGFFYEYRPVVAAKPWTQEQCLNHKFGLIDFGCDHYLSSEEEYRTYDSHNIVNYVRFSEEMYQRMEADVTGPARPLQTLFKAREDKPYQNLGRPEVINAIKLHELERQGKHEAKAELEKSIRSEQKNREYAEAGVGEASEEVDWEDVQETPSETDTTFYDENLQKKVQQQWARVTDPPSLNLPEELLMQLDSLSFAKPRFESVDLNDEDEYDDIMAAGEEEYVQEIKGEQVGHESVYEPPAYVDREDVNTE
ncbi:Dolichyl-phosphate-mannose--protein mannosyltransferase 1 [Yarrowia sp. C11]|nr:Dolichyl-phosphate-mannose--protein mannosyltransferase 1 [Yarrowia sp. C11]